MKLFLLVSLPLFFSGCGLTNITYHGVKLAAKRSDALTREEIPDAIQITSQISRARPFLPSERIVVLSCMAGETRFSDHALQPALREQIESVLVQGLLEKGYRGASRLNIPHVLLEKAFPTGRLDPAALRDLFKGSTLLLCTVNRSEVEPVDYQWSGGDFGSDGKGNVGTHINFDCSVELLDSNSAEILWLTTARLDCVLRRNLTTGAVIEQILRRVARALPMPAGTPSPATSYAPAILAVPGQPTR
ncbi:MAG: hypothetical protein L0Z50_09895 [Verrucomicrobiales bacterium]|nr:hypothetical protein [Verrucomicrobiales bacterium]